jgi:beta-glucanase (GH16 family)
VKICLTDSAGKEVFLKIPRRRISKIKEKEQFMLVKLIFKHLIHIPVFAGIIFCFASCAYEYNEKNLTLYKNYFKPKYVEPVKTDCETYEAGFDRKTWSLVWSDEFEYNGLPDTNRWDYDIGLGEEAGWGNRERQFYTGSRLENARVEDGKLVIEARKENYLNSGYTSARLVTRGKADWKYGKIDIKAKLPSGRGVWPALWLLPAKDIYKLWAEIDIMEQIGFNPDMVHLSVQTHFYNGKTGNDRTACTTLDKPYEKFHVYSLEWYPETIHILVDGALYFTYNKRVNTTPQIWPFNQNMYLIMNIAVGGDWGGLAGVDDSIFPQRMEVDYVRVYKKVHIE